ncbi:MAG: UDP-4-amino-4,6-dideoxy-N-acetyl-beta-L-altrosamine transaminase [Syntrophorhabdus sp. PtaU1.Bin153]|nr:MAG: UDP-4-amino-4,6-dideoxy-N-acetyl-beta-L-altrosamine transaminase [Syntrophorhabdus sp. PtaU1.Bin153]
MSRIIPYSCQSVDEEDITAVVSVLKSDYLTQGPAVERFEAALTSYTGAKYAVVYSSGTAALHASYFAAGLGAGDELITSPITFVATSNAALYVGARPVFSDIERDSANLDVTRIEEKITERTKVIVPVHYAGHPVDMEAIRAMAEKHGIKVVEDGCHALGASSKSNAASPWTGQNGEERWAKVGSCSNSDMTVLSFHPVKHITTGEGGAVLTNEKSYYESLLMFRSHGITKNKSCFKMHDCAVVGDWYYEMQFLGYNYRMTDIQAALGTAQLTKLEKFVKRRREIASTYNGVFVGNNYFETPMEKQYGHSSYHLYPIRLKDGYWEKRPLIFSKMREHGLGVQVLYIPVYLQPFYKEIGYRQGACPVAEDFYRRAISLPIYPAMSVEDIDYVINHTFKVFEEVEE